jgi:hypothetical protein
MNASKLIDKQIADLGDWRGIVFARLRKLILAADPDIIEEWKWNTAVWTHSGMVCAVGGFKDHVKMNFFKAHPWKTHVVFSMPALKQRQREPSTFTIERSSPTMGSLPGPFSLKAFRA